MNKKFIETLTYGTICLVERLDNETNEGFFDMHQDNEEGGYYGELWTDSDIDEITSEMVEEQIDENLYN